jgi:hypothetical protein
MGSNPQEVKAEGEFTFRRRTEQVEIEGISCIGLLLLLGLQNTIPFEVSNKVLPPTVIGVDMEELGAGIPLCKPRDHRPLPRDSALKRR